MRRYFLVQVRLGFGKRDEERKMARRRQVSDAIMLEWMAEMVEEMVVRDRAR